MKPILNISDAVNLSYNRWVTSCDDDRSYFHFKQFYSHVRRLAKSIISKDYHKHRNDFDDIFSELMEKVQFAAKNRQINNLDFFHSWFRVTLKNHILNLNKYENRKKREFLTYEHEMGFSLSKAEEKYCMDNFYRAEQQSDVIDTVNQLFSVSAYNELLQERYYYGLSIEELAVKYNTTVHAINGRMKRSKQKFRKEFKNLVSEHKVWVSDG